MNAVRLYPCRHCRSSVDNAQQPFAAFLVCRIVLHPSASSLLSALFLHILKPINFLLLQGDRGAAGAPGAPGAKVMFAPLAACWHSGLWLSGSIVDADPCGCHLEDMQTGQAYSFTHECWCLQGRTGPRGPPGDMGQPGEVRSTRRTEQNTC